MAASRNRGVALKMEKGLKVWLKICLALLLITIAPQARAIKICQFRSYESYLKNRATPNALMSEIDAYGLHEQGDGRSYSVEASEDSDTTPFTEENSDRYGFLSCNDHADLQVTQDSQFTPDGMPLFIVTFTNTCLQCDFFDIHIDCGDFESPVMVHPYTFRRLSDGNCLLNNGGRLAAQNSVSFEYESTDPFPMTVRRALVTCKA